MSELAGLSEEGARLQYAEPGFQTAIRFNLYNYADYGEGAEMHRLILDSIPMGFEGTVADLGCGNGELLVSLRTERKAQGRLIGIDVWSDPALAEWHVAQLNQASPGTIRPIEFHQRDAAETGLPEDSVDIVISAFTLYHMDDPGAALREIHRILRPGGRLIAATSCEGNKQRHREFESLVAAKLGVEPPPIFSARCDDKILEQLLRQIFPSFRHMEFQDLPMRITPDLIDEYLLSLETMGSACRPSVHPVAWSAALNNFVRPEIEREICESGTGYFEDRIVRVAYEAIKEVA